MAGQGPSYRAEAAGALIVEPLDGLTLVFHRPSAMTHILASPAPEILAAMGDEMSDAAGVLAKLEARFDLDGEDGLSIVTARLDELAALGLVRRL